jgi:hypothetical protein
MPAWRATPDIGSSSACGQSLSTAPCRVSSRAKFVASANAQNSWRTMRLQFAFRGSCSRPVANSVTAMLQRISDLRKLKIHLQSLSAKFDDGAANDVSGEAALEQLRIAAECRNLDQEITKLSNRLWMSMHH